MRHIVIQYLEVGEMITIEFKLSEDNKVLVYASKEIKTFDDYNEFMDQMIKKLSPVEDQVMHNLKMKAKKRMMVPNI